MRCIVVVVSCALSYNITFSLIHYIERHSLRILCSSCKHSLTILSSKFDHMCKSRSSQHPYHHHSHKSLSSGLKMEVQTQSDQKMKVATTDSSSISTVSTSSTSSQEEQQPQPLSSPTKSTKAIPSSSSLDPFQETMRAKSALHQKGKKNAKQSSIDYISWGILAIVLMITIFTYPQENIMNGVSIQHVFYNGWITAVATGVGVLPFFFLSEPDKYWMGISNGK